MESYVKLKRYFLDKNVNSETWLKKKGRAVIINEIEVIRMDLFQLPECTGPGQGPRTQPQGKSRGELKGAGRRGDGRERERTWEGKK